MLFSGLPCYRHFCMLLPAAFSRERQKNRFLPASLVEIKE
jgi:hypothetical protein